MNKESGDLARHTSAAKYFDRKADHLDKVIADGRKGGMSKNTINALDKRRGILHDRKQGMKRVAAGNRKEIAQDKKDLNMERLPSKQYQQSCKAFVISRNKVSLIIEMHLTFSNIQSQLDDHSFLSE